MATESINTIQIQAYTPAGFRVYVNVPLQSASEIDTLLQDSGFLASAPGAEPGEVVETMTHVSRRMHASKKDGKVTPVIAFYHENEALNFKYDHMYMNTEEQIAEFEGLSGMKLMSIPEYPADQFLDRTSAKASQFIIPLPKPVKVAAADKPYTRLDGTAGITKKIQRLLSSVQKQPSTPSTVWNKSEMATFWKDWKSRGVDDADILKVLGVEKLSEWKHSLNTANEHMELAQAS